VSGIDGENVFATTYSYSYYGYLLYYLKQEGNDVTREIIAAPKSLLAIGYSLAAALPEQLEFEGVWNHVGLGVENVEMRAITSWSTTEDQSVTESFTWGLSQSIAAEVKTGFLVAGSKVTVTVGSSQEWGESVTSTISNMQGGQSWYSCSSRSCANGNLFQWMIKGTNSNGHVENIKQCSFVCVPLETSDEPRCPPRDCGDESCQCCKEEWAEGGNPPESPLCTTANMRLGKSIGNETDVCYGCD